MRSNGTTFPCNNKVESEILGSRLTAYVCKLLKKKKKFMEDKPLATRYKL
jgi:hypothetical protein